MDSAGSDEVEFLLVDLFDLNDEEVSKVVDILKRAKEDDNGQ